MPSAIHLIWMRIWKKWIRIQVMNISVRFTEFLLTKKNCQIFLLLFFCLFVSSYRFPSAIMFYSISGEFEQILLKIAFKTMATHAVSFSAMMRKMCIILMISNTTKTLENSFMSYQYDFLLWHTTR